MGYPCVIIVVKGEKFVALIAIVFANVSDDTTVKFGYVHSREILVNNEQPVKTMFPIFVTDVGNVAVVNLTHPSKTCDPIDVTPDGIVILVNEEHP